MLKNYFSMGLFVLRVCKQKYLKLDKCFGVKSFVESVNGFNILKNARRSQADRGKRGFTLDRM
jgi:hypothetical protein